MTDQMMALMEYLRHNRPEQDVLSYMAFPKEQTSQNSIFWQSPLH